MDFRGALFDFDGVIVDSTPTHLSGWKAAYFELFNDFIDEITLASIVGRSTAAIGSLLAVKSGYPAAKKELIRRKQLHVFANLNTISLINGAAEFISELTGRRIPFGIVSNAPRDFIEAAIKQHNLKVPFFFGLDDYRKPKPDAEPYMKGALAIGFTFKEHPRIFVFEDSTNGIDAAIAAHMTPIGICSQHLPEVLLAAGAKICFKDLEAAKALIS
jgi:beta-phosphoglucomutase-like phosphatase (HAD superfamily)